MAAVKLACDGQCMSGSNLQLLGLSGSKKLAHIDLQVVVQPRLACYRFTMEIVFADLTLKPLLQLLFREYGKADPKKLINTVLPASLFACGGA